MNTNLLSTGKIAKLYSVTPDTVLKWIKSGKLHAQRTAGGHYRVHPEELNGFLSANSHNTAHKTRTSTLRPIQFCWEYNGKGKLIKECQECIVYQMRAQRCYEVLKLVPEMSHKKLFCKGGCQDCEYYLQVREKPTGILFITGNAEMVASFKREAKHHRYRVEIADCGYQCSLLMEEFKPDYVVIDCALGPESSRHMCHHVKEDSRIPYVRVILAAEEGQFPDGCDKEVFAYINTSSGTENIADCIFSEVNDNRNNDRITNNNFEDL